MTSVSPLLRERWRSGHHVGGAKPNMLVEIQRGLIDRHYAEFVMLDGSTPDFGDIVGSRHNAKPWQAFWRATGAWKTIPNVERVTFDDNMAVDGTSEPTACTIDIANILYKQTNGVAGIFHAIKRGMLSPFYGWTTMGRTPNPQAVRDPADDWFDVLNGGCRVRIYQGYGDAMEPVFTGLIDDTDLVSHPDRITITCRNFGCIGTDCRILGWNKAKEIPSPIVFADRLSADNTKKVGGAAAASSTLQGHSPSNVLKKGGSQDWMSQGHTTPDNTEWVEIHVPRGRYETVYIAPEYDGMEVYLGIYARGGTKVDGVAVANNTWYTRGAQGNVPGVNGGWGIAKHWKSLSKGGQSQRLGFKLECGDNTVIRVGFRNLGFSPSHGDYRAKCSRLVAFQRTLRAEAKNNNWILVDDAADMVKWAFMWMGFHEWRVDPLGVRLKLPVTFHQGQFLVDIVKYVVSQANVVYYIDRPSADPNSIGVPVLERSRALEPPGEQEEVRDTDLLTGVQAKFSKQDLSFIIRMRGKSMTKKKGGVAFGEEKTPRVQATYWPPWSGAHRDVVSGKYDASYPSAGRMAGLWKHWTQFDAGVETQDEAMMGCLLIAIQQALGAFTGSIEVPGFPGFQQNGHVSIVDTGTGLNTRLWIAHMSSTFTTGQQVEWKTTLGGAMIDTPDMLLLAFDYLALLYKVQLEHAI